MRHSDYTTYQEELLQSIYDTNFRDRDKTVIKGFFMWLLESDKRFLLESIPY